MELTLTEEQKQIKALAKEFFQKEIDQKKFKEIIEKVERTDSIEELRAIQPDLELKKMHEVGLRQLAVPMKYGGTEPETGRNVLRTIVAEEAGYWGGMTAANLMTSAWFFCPIMSTNTYVKEEQREWFFSEFMNNPALLTGATVSEPSGMTDILLPYMEPGYTMKTTAVKDGDEWIINGDKMFSSDGGIADINIVGTRTNPDGDPSNSLTFFWVHRDQPGVTMKINKFPAASLAGNVQTHYENVRVPEVQMMGQPNYGGELGYSIGESAFEVKWMHVPLFVGGMQRLYEQMVQYAKERIVGGRPIIEHTNIAAVLGEAAIDLETLRSLCYRAAVATDIRQEKGGPINGFWNLAVWNFWKRTAWRFCQIASEVYGGIVNSKELPFEGFFRFVFMVQPAGATTTMEAIMSSMAYNNHVIESMFPPGK